MFDVSYKVTYSFRLDFKWYYISVFRNKCYGDIHFLTETFNVFIYLNAGRGGGSCIFSKSTEPYFTQ